MDHLCSPSVSGSTLSHDPKQSNFIGIKSADSHSKYCDTRDQRRQALKHLDEAKFGMFHIRAVLVSGVGFFTDAYDLLYIINLVVPMLGYVYFADNHNKVPDGTDGLIKGMATAGTFVGQLVFGFLADRLGRKKMYGIELMIMIVATLGCALSADTVRGVSAIAMLCFWRFILGVGIGGDYPLSAIITSEFASVNKRGMMMAAVFSMQGIGIFVSALVSLITLLCFKSKIKEDPLNLDYVWRICLGLGVVPALIALYFRLTIPETPRYTMAVSRNTAKAYKDVNKVLGLPVKFQKPMDMSLSKDDTRIDLTHIIDDSFPQAPLPPREVQHKKNSWKDFKCYFGKWRNFKILFGCSFAWFALDVAFYGVNLNQSIILQAVSYTPKDASAYDTMFSLVTGNLFIALMGTVPGYFVTVALIERMGRIPIQLLGFTMLTIIFIVLSAAYYQLLQSAKIIFIILFALANFFFNFGPNTTTFVLPGESFTTRWRSTGHGISAASGKAGAALAAYAFKPMTNIGGKGKFIPGILGIFAGFMFLGLLATFLVPETKGRTLEEIADDEHEYTYGDEHNHPHTSPQKMTEDA